MNISKLMNQSIKIAKLEEFDRKVCSKICIVNYNNDPEVTMFQRLEENIINAHTENEIIRIMNQAGFYHIETYILSLHDEVKRHMKIHRKEFYIDLESLKTFVLFLIDFPFVNPSRFTFSHKWYHAGMLWFSPKHDCVFMSFLPEKKIRFCATYGKIGKEKHVDGTISFDAMLEYMKSQSGNDFNSIPERIHPKQWKRQ